MGDYSFWCLVESGFAMEEADFVLSWQCSPFDPVKGQFNACAVENFFGKRGNVQVSWHEGQIVMVIGCPEGQAWCWQFEVVWDFNGPLADSGSFDVDTCDAVAVDWIL